MLSECFYSHTQLDLAVLNDLTRPTYWSPAHPYPATLPMPFFRRPYSLCIAILSKLSFGIVNTNTFSHFYPLGKFTYFPSPSPPCLDTHTMLLMSRHLDFPAL